MRASGKSVAVRLRASQFYRLFVITSNIFVKIAHWVFKFSRSVLSSNHATTLFIVGRAPRLANGVARSVGHPLDAVRSQTAHMSPVPPPGTGLFFAPDLMKLRRCLWGFYWHMS
jgi:hypothetical protein